MQEGEGSFNSFHPNEDNSPDSDQFIKRYQHGWDEGERRIESAHPLHPITQEPGSFTHRYIRGSHAMHPVYRTDSGDEFVTVKGQPKLLNNSQEE